MTFAKAFGFVHRESLAFMFACPLLALVPILAEFAQHFVEMRIGMYDRPAGAAAAESHPLRMSFGLVKVLALTFAGYWVVRFLAGGRDAEAARTWEPRAVWLFSIVLALQMLLTVLGLFVFPANDAIGIGFMIFGFILGPLIARFTVAAPLGIWISPLRSIRHTAPHIVFAVGFSLLAMLPLMIVHYALGIGAIFVAGSALKWAMLIADSLLVGWLAALLIAIAYVVALRPGPLENREPISNVAI